MVRTLTKEDNFNLLVSKGKILIDFYADWCGPCRMLTPVLESIEEIDVLKVNIDTFNDIATKFGVMSIPTLVLMGDGQVLKKVIGFKTKEEILKIIA